MESPNDLERILDDGSTPTLKDKVVEWGKRYGPAEIIGTAVAYAGSFLTYKATDSEVAAAFGATWGENVGFYGTMLVREMRADSRSANESGESYGVGGAAKTIRNLFLEFGASEYLDSFVVRPLTMGIGTKFLGREFGVLAGKLAADVSFYIPAILSYELRKKVINRNNDGASDC